jgi:hypothetical protein
VRLPRVVAQVCLFAVAPLIAACGTTVSGSQAGTNDGGSALGGPTAATGTAGNTAGSATASLPGGSGQGNTVASGIGGATSVTNSSIGGSTSTTSASKAPFKVGALYSSNAQAALTALGAKGSIGDVKGEGDAVVAYINAHGGVGGRKMVVKWYDGDATQPAATIAAEACASWTQDDHVDAAAPGGSIVDMNTIRACLAKANTPATSVEYHVQTRAQNFTTSPLWIEPLGLSMESYARSFAEGLAAQGFFRGGRLGIVYDDGPDWSAVERSVLEPTLSRLGVTVVARATYQLRGFSDVAGSESAVNSAVLNFKTNGVTRVITFEPWDGYAFFMQSADRQDFHPTYGLSSQAAFAATYATGLVPADQLTGAYFIGWSPILDDPDRPAGWARERLCLSILDRANLHPDGPLAMAIALSGCDGFLDLADLGKAANGNLNASTFRSSLARVSWQSALLPTVGVTANRPYGVVALRDGRWNAGCGCFVFSGATRPAPS